MYKKLSKLLAIAFALGIVVVGIIVFVIQTSVSVSNASESAAARLSDVELAIAENDAEITKLRAELDAEYISKTAAFAEMIKVNPSILKKQSEIDNIKNILNVDELHVTDKKGVIRYGTVAEYIGFDFSSSEQSVPFMECVENPDFQLAQDPQPNGTEGKLFQYIGVARLDEPGVVQIGMTPSRLTEAMEEADISNALKNFTLGQTGFVFAVNKSDNTIVAFKDANLIGTDASEVGIDSDILKDNSKGKVTKIDGNKYFTTSKELDEYIIITALPYSELYGSRNMVTAATIGIAIFTFLAIAVFINIIIKKNVLDGINEINKNMSVISSGDISVNVNVNTCEEFETLSNGINGMLESIREKISQSESDNEKKQNLFIEISGVARNITSFSKNMENISRNISNGAATQSATVEELSATFETILKQVKETTAATENANRISENTTVQLRKGINMIDEMQLSMSKIGDASTKINNIVKTISDIAFQTNILALNAAVEAARAGEHGKGFSVVADEVRTLSTMCSNAVQGTTSLIEETLSTVDEGLSIAQRTAEQLHSMAKGFLENDELIHNISEAAAEQARELDEISASMSQISNEVQTFASVANDAEEASRRLETEANSLQHMMIN